MRAFRLGYVALEVPEPEKHRRYLDQVIGITETASAGGTSYHSLGLDHHNLAITGADRRGLQSIGLFVTGEASDVLARMRAAGCSAEIRHDSRPGVPCLVSVEAPGGCKLELFPEMAQTAPGFRRGGVTPLGLGHVAVASPDASKLTGLLTETLGFHVTDRIETLATFLTCTHDHHVLNVIDAPVPVTLLHHMAFGLRDSAHQYLACDQLATASLPIVWGPSRHTAGHNYASYHFDPSGFLVEFYADIDVFVPELGCFEPRPWHKSMPQRPMTWPATQLSNWDTVFGFDFVSVLTI